MNPRLLFRRVAIAEAITWALLLTGMVFKYTDVTEVGVQVFGMVHGVVFVAYCLTTVLVAIDQRWSFGRTLLGLAAAVPPFFTVLFDWYAERRNALADTWRLRDAEPTGPLQKPAAWLIRNPARGAVTGVVAVVALTGLALLVGPPA